MLGSVSFSKTKSLVLCLVVLMGTAGLPAFGKVFYSKTEAIELAFPDADRTERLNFVLTDAQVEAVQKLARTKLEKKIIAFHRGWKADELQGYALIDIHTVRTFSEALLVVLDATGMVQTVRTLAFHEPEDYLPPQRWLDQFKEKALSPELRLKGEIHGIAGATLSARAVTGSVRLTLALYEVLIRQAQPKE